MKFAALKPRILENVKKLPNGCWNWLGNKDRQGYGYCYFVPGQTKAPRASYRIFKGRIPKDKLIMHSCDNPSCVNPEHLSVGTHAENQAQKAERGRSLRGELNNSAKLTREEVLEIFRDDRAYRVIAADYGVSHSVVGNIKRGQTWDHVTGKKLTQRKYAKGIKNWRAALTPRQVRAVRASSDTHAVLAERFNVPYYVIQTLRAGITYKDVR